MEIKNWMLYGAYGYTGKLILEEAIKNDLNPVLAGRNSEKLISLAEKNSLEYKVFNLDDQKIINETIEGFDLVLNAAGPFNETSLPIVKGCLENSSSYMDITGEINVFEKNFSFHERARDLGIVLISGVGFDVVPSDCLIKYVSEKVENPTHLELGVAGLGGLSGGTLKTMIKNLPYGTVVRRDGKIILQPMGKNPKEIRFMDKIQKKLYPISWGDIATAYRSTKIPNITVYMQLPKYFNNLTGPIESLVRKILKLETVQNMIMSWIENNVEGPNEEERGSAKSYLWAKAYNENTGDSYEAWLKTLESYQLTAVSAIKCIKKLDNSNINGALTPSQAFGKDFILEFPKTERRDTL